MYSFSVMVLIPLLLAVSLVQLAALPSKPLHTTPPEDAWQAWLLLDHEHKPAPAVDPYLLSRRRITPKSVFIVPELSPDALPDCADGYQPDALLRCVKLVKVNEEANLQYLLDKLKMQYATESTGDSDEEDYDYEEDTDKTEPLQINIPFASPMIGDEVKKPPMEVTVTKKDVISLISSPVEIVNKTENVGNKDLLIDNNKNITDTKDAANTSVTFLQSTEHRVNSHTSERPDVHDEKSNSSTTGYADIQNKNSTSDIFHKETETPSTDSFDKTKTDVNDKDNSFLHKDDTIYDYNGSQIKNTDVSSASSYANISVIDAIIDKIVPLPSADDVASETPSTQTEVSVIMAPANGKFGTTVADELVSQILNLKVDKVSHDIQTSDTIKKDATKTDLTDSTTESDYESTIYNEGEDETTYPEFDTDDSTESETTETEESTTYKSPVTLYPENDDKLSLQDNLSYLNLKDTILVTRLSSGPITEADFVAPDIIQSEQQTLKESLEPSLEQLEMLKNINVPKKPLREILPQNSFNGKISTNIQSNTEELLNKDTELFQGDKIGEDNQKYVHSNQDEIGKVNNVKSDVVENDQKVDITKEVVPKDYVRFPDEIASETRNSGFVKFPDTFKVISTKNTIVPKVTEKPQIQKPFPEGFYINRPSITSEKSPYWWVPEGWEVDNTRQQPMLLRFWSKMPLVKDPAVFIPPPVTHRPTGIRQTSGHRGDGRYPSQQYYREVSAQNILNILGQRNLRNIRQHR